MKLALVYDRINKFGGAERILSVLHQLWPRAPLYTAVYHPATASWADTIKVFPSWLNHWPLAKTHHELYPWLTPLAFESFNFDQFDVVISITSAEAKAIITKPKTLHLCYCLTPTRYLWSHQSAYELSPGLGVFNRLGRLVFKSTKNYLQQFDLIASQRPDYYFATSQTVKNRIKNYYHRNSEIIYPPVDFTKFSQTQPKADRPLPEIADYFLVVSRLTPYKNVDLVIKACNQLQQPLVIVGRGREESNLKNMAGPTIKFVGLINDEKLISLYQHSKALIMPQEEDFGIVSLESQAAGRPVIALKKGGATETVIAGQTGLFFLKPTVDSLLKTMKQFNSFAWSQPLIKNQAQKFDNMIFKQKFLKAVEGEWINHQKNFP